MDFRIIQYAGQQILLERIEEEGAWKIVIGVYLNVVDRFDEWIDGESVEDVQSKIEAFSTVEVHDFLERAIAWVNQDHARKSRKVNNATA